MSIKRIRRAIRKGRYEYTLHALEEMDDDDLTDRDVRWVLLNGVIEAELTHDPRGTRFVVRGMLRDLMEVEVVCRFLMSGSLRIITVYVPKE